MILTGVKRPQIWKDKWVSALFVFCLFVYFNKFPLQWKMRLMQSNPAKTNCFWFYFKFYVANKTTFCLDGICDFKVTILGPYIYSLMIQWGLSVSFTVSQALRSVLTLTFWATDTFQMKGKVIHASFITHLSSFWFSTFPWCLES